ncbi:hypothetical protein FQN57_004560 [Myotisia sp. PD_48]|nr:hypothetical protein FQN57_004560 [Myotisia sp. PD_48]
MADYEVSFPSTDPTLSQPLEVLATAGVRYCVVGDLVIMALGGPLLLSDIYLAVADDQLELARSALASQGFDEWPQTHKRFFCAFTTKESATGWPGYRFLPQEVGPNDGPDRYYATSTILIPASFWYLDLSPESWTTTTFLVPGTVYRFPPRLVYLRALIDALTERVGDDDLNGPITGYFNIQYSYTLNHFTADTLSHLPVEDQFFVDLYTKVPVVTIRKKLGYLRKQIRAGILTPEKAYTLVPYQKHLEVAALRKQRRKPGKGGKPSLRFPLESNNVSVSQDQPENV